MTTNTTDPEPWGRVRIRVDADRPEEKARALEVIDAALAAAGYRLPPKPRHLHLVRPARASYATADDPLPMEAP